MIKINSILPLSPESREKDNVDFLKSQWISPEFLYKEKILPEWADVTDFADEMRRALSAAHEFWRKIRWFTDSGNAMAYVAPKPEPNTINFNLSTVALNSKARKLGETSFSRDTIIHESNHLKQNRVTGNAYSPPAFDELSSKGRSEIFKNAGLPEMAIREVVEGLIQSSTEKMTGRVDKNCAYTYFEVPAMKKLDAYMEARVWVSPIACFVEMSEASMSRLREAIIRLNNELMVEGSFTKKWKKPTERQLKQAHAIAKNKARDWEIFENVDESWDILRKTPAPVVEVIEDKRTQVAHVLDQIKEKEVIPENIFEEELVNTGTTYELRNKTADRVSELAVNRNDLWLGA